MSVQQAFTKSFELYQQGVKHKLSRINGKWTVVVNCGEMNLQERFEHSMASVLSLGHMPYQDRVGYIKSLRLTSGYKGKELDMAWDAFMSGIHIGKEIANEER